MSESKRDPGLMEKEKRGLGGEGTGGRWKGWATGLVLTGAAGFSIYALAWRLGSYGYAFLVVVPLALGFVLGYLTRGSKNFLPILALALVATLAGAAVVVGFAGLLCALVYAVAIAVPANFGLVAGQVLSGWLGSRGSRQWKLAMAPMILIPLALLYLEGRIEHRYPIETVSTSRVLELSAESAWERITFFEDVRLEPPALARIGLPHPLFTRGEIRAVGDVTTCVYDSGHLRKRTTEIRPGRRLAFEVIEQQGIEDRSIELIDGGFELEEIGPGRTRVTLTTRYRPLLQARSLWRPFEHRLTRVLHRHVLDGIAAAAGRGLMVAAGDETDAHRPR